MLRCTLLITLLTFSLVTQAALPTDAIQRCLDIRRLADFSTRQKIAAKSPDVSRFTFHKIASSELPLDNPVGNMQEVISALEKQIANCKKNRAEFQNVTIAGRTFKRQEWCLDTNKKMLAIAQASRGNFHQYIARIKTEFKWYKSDGWPGNHAGYKKGDFQFTAYYAPAAIEARSKRGGEFVYPVYRNPGVVHAASESKKLHRKTPLCGVDPLTGLPRGFCMKHADGTYSPAPDRAEINQGALHPKYVIGYVKDPNDPDFLMVEGSGSLRLDGQVIPVNYDSSNGRPRTMLGRIVQCAQDPTCGGNLDAMERCAKNPRCHDDAKLRCNVSQQIRQSAANEKHIRHYLDHQVSPEKAADLRNRDQSFVFFAEGGPYGSENILLTPHVSCATDHRVIPVGMNFIYHCKKSTTWCVAQDTGGAIVGAHVDVYKGEGNQAGIEANALNHPGALYVALPK